MTLTAFVEFLLQAALASAGAIWLFSTKLGEKYISHRFDRKISELEHNQNAKIEGLRAQLANVTDRGRHANKGEFDALTEIWELLVTAYLSTSTCIASLMEYPDMSRLTEDEILVLFELDRSKRRAAQICSQRHRPKRYLFENRHAQPNKQSGSFHLQCSLSATKERHLYPFPSGS